MTPVLAPEDRKLPAPEAKAETPEPATTNSNRKPAAPPRRGGFVNRWRR